MNLDNTAIFAVFTALSGMVLGWLGRTRSIRKDAA